MSPSQVDSSLHSTLHESPPQAIAPEHDCLPEHEMAQMSALQAIAPSHESAPHTTVHDEPPHVIDPPHAWPPLQLIVQLAADAQLIVPGQSS